MHVRSLPLRLITTVFLAALAILSPAGTMIKAAEAGPPPEPAAAPTGPTGSEPAPDTTKPPEPGTAPKTLREKMTAIGKTMDETHENLEFVILNQVIRLDKFFGNAKSEQQQKNEYDLRWSNSVRVEKGGHIRLGTNVRANIKLTRISERLRLSVSGGDEPEPLSPRLPEDPGNPGFDRTTLTNTRLVNTELRYGLFHTPSSDLFLGAGVRLVIPPEAFVRSRYQYTHHLSDLTLVRFGETLFVKNPVGPGETTEVDLEHSLNQKTFLRWSNSGTISYEISGMEWGTELSLIRELSSKSAITVTGGVYGNTSVNDWVTSYRVLTRYRRNFLRPWLYYEIEPEMSWPRVADGYFPTSFAMTFRIEIQFHDTDTGMTIISRPP